MFRRVGDTGVAEIFESGGSIQPKPIMLSEKIFLSGKKIVFSIGNILTFFEIYFVVLQEPHVTF